MRPSDKVWLKSNNAFCKTYVFMFLLFKRSLFSFKQVSVWTVLLCSINGIFCLLHIFLGRLFTHFVFLFRLSPLDTIKENVLIFSLVFSRVKRSIIQLAILLKVSSKFKSFVPTWSIKCFGVKSWIDGFAWSYVQLTLSELIIDFWPNFYDEVSSLSSTYLVFLPCCCHEWKTFSDYWYYFRVWFILMLELS